MFTWWVFSVALHAMTGAGLLESVAQQPPAACVVPSPPSDLVASVGPKGITLTWKASATGTPSGYAVEYGNAPGSTYLGTFPIEGPVLSHTRELSAGVIHVRVRARSACGTSEASPELRVAVNTNQVAAPPVPDVVVARRASDRNPYFPTAELLKNGDILVVYYDSPDHVSPAGRIAMVRSRDQGRTWSEPAVVFDGDRDERDPNIMQTSKGEVLLTFFQSIPKDPSAQAVYLMRSGDDGRTWSPPARINTILHGTATSSKIVELEDGELLMPLYGILEFGDHAVSSVVRSSDGGLTWPADREMLLASDGERDYVEPAIVSLGGGRLFAMVRTDSKPNMSYATYSLDSGRTWSLPTATGFNAHASDLLLLEGGPNGVVLHAWGDWSRRFGASRPTMMQVIRFAGFPAVAKPDRLRLLYHGNCFDDESYPSSVRLASGQILTVYYDVCAGYLAGTFTTLPGRTPPACRATPAPPRNLRLAYNRERVVTMAWDGDLKAPHSYILQASTTPGGSDILDVDVGQMTGFSRPLVASGTYYVAVRARNECGVGRRSNQLTVVVP